jgi:hypothetical protein
MKEVKGNAWHIIDNYDALCITTNGYIKSNGECVMGRGIALEAKKRLRTLPRTLGLAIKYHGNNVHKLFPKYRNTVIISFPVKHNWWEKADIKLIERSAHQLVKLTDKQNFKRVLLPRPGCGNGKLKWDEVKLVLEPIFDDRFYVVSY